MLYAGINLILQRQIYWEGLHKLEIVSQRMRVEDGLFASLVDNNLYLIDIFSPKPLAMTAINKNTLWIWDCCPGYLGYQNIIRVAVIFEFINLSKPLSENVCILYTEANILVKPHKDLIQPGLESFDLVYRDVSGPHITELYEAKYYVTFLCNAIKRFEAILLKQKSEVLLAFKDYYLRNEKGDKRIWRLCIDGSGEYDFKEFAEFQ